MKRRYLAGVTLILSLFAILMSADAVAKEATADWQETEIVTVAPESVRIITESQDDSAQWEWTASDEGNSKADNVKRSAANTGTSRDLISDCVIIKANASDPLGGTCSGAYGIVGEEGRIRAWPNDGYRFVCWFNEITQKIVSTEVAYTFQITEQDTFFTAFFAPQGYYFMFSCYFDRFSGTLLSATPNKGLYSSGEEIRFHADVDSGRRLKGIYYTDDLVHMTQLQLISATQDGTLNMPNKDILAIALAYSAEPHKVSISTNMENGSAALADGSTSADFYGGDTVTVTFSPASGYRLTEISGIPEEYEYSNNVLTFTMPDWDVVISAKFVKTIQQNIYGWTPKDGGTVSVVSNSLTGTDTATAIPNEGYRFVYWYNYATHEEVSSNPVWENIPAEGSLYIALFKEVGYHVVVLSSAMVNGTLTTEKTVYEPGETVKMVATPDPGYAIYKYGWGKFTPGVGGDLTATDEDSFIMPNNDVCVMAVFNKACTLTILGDASTITGGGVYAKGKKVILTAAEKPGYVFVAWKSEDGRTLSTKSKYEFKIESDTTLKAVYVRLSAIEYDGTPVNGTVTGCGTYREDRTFTLTAKPDPGYRFVRWELTYKTEGPRTFTSNPLTLPASEDMKVKAVFVRNEYTVQYDAGEATCDVPEAVKADEGEKVEIPTVTMTREGYDFLGWATKATATEAEYHAGDSITVTGNITLYAIWKKQSFRLTFDVSGGNGTVEAINAFYGVPVTIPKFSVTREGCYFMGWAESDNATAAQYKSGSMLTLTAEKTLYAVWKKQSFKLTFDTNGGTGSMAAITALYGATVAVPKSTITRTGYYFLGWAESATATAAQYKTGSTLTITAAKTLYAVWKPQTRKLTFDLNGGTGTVPATVTVNYGTAAKIGKASVSRTGYYFMGWATMKTAMAAEYKTGSTIVLTDNVTLYAVWKPQTRKLTFDLNGGTGTVPATVTVNYGATAKVGKGSVSREGYYFLGWATTKTATAAEYKTGSTLTLTDNVTLYAVWKKR